ncbi:cytochrome P450 [Leucobacter sp. HY1910]
MSERQGAEQEVIALTNMRESQTLLRAQRATTQAGFTAERIPQRFFARRPILIDDGDEHLEHRRQLVRFFSPRTLEMKHRAFIERTAQEYVAGVQQQGGCALDELALHFSVRVASEIVGLTQSSVPALAQRLEAFFRQPEVDHTRGDHGRTRKDWIRAARNALTPLFTFYMKDVRPAIRAHRRVPQDDVIGHLLEQGYRPREILMECLTYGTAGMVTTREFMSMTMLYLLREESLRAQYLKGDYRERIAILSEIIRLEPPVAHIYRRVQASTTECPHSEGALVDVNVRQANRDPQVFEPNPEAACPARQLAASERTGLSFGDGPHRCPGSHLALLETDALVRSLLTAGATLEREPDHEFDTLVQGYKLRGFTLRFESPAREL